MKCCCGICGDFLEGGLIVNSIVRQMRPSDIFINQSNHCVLLWNVFVLSAHQFQYQCVPKDKCVFRALFWSSKTNIGRFNYGVFRTLV